jgi:hypothetical protein
VSGDPDAWRSLGLVVGDDGLIALHGTCLRIRADSGPPAGHDRDDDHDEVAGPSGITGWTLSGIDAELLPSAPSSASSASSIADDPSSNVSSSNIFSIDGLATEVVPGSHPVFAAHRLGAIGLDHVVVMTSQLDRTSAAIAEATGCELKRIREVGSMRQGFHRIGSGGLIVELVERPEVPDGPAAFWGLVINVDDLDAACALLGDGRISSPKDAVQPGRRIATIRNDVGLGLPVALMTP